MSYQPNPKPLFVLERAANSAELHGRDLLAADARAAHAALANLIEASNDYIAATAGYIPAARWEELAARYCDHDAPTTGEVIVKARARWHAALKAVTP